MLRNSHLQLYILTDRLLTPSVIRNSRVAVSVTHVKMADELDENSSAVEDQKPQKKVAKHDSGAADLEKVTDYAEEKEISSKDIQDAMSLIGDKHSKETAEKAARQKELAKVTIKKEDVELIMRELEISRNVAELKLREHRGNVVDALIELTN